MENESALHRVQETLAEASSAHQLLYDDAAIHGQIARWSAISAEAIRNGGAIFFAGNGGSFADAQHLAAELTGKMGRLRGPLPGIALGTNSSSLTAIANDFAYEEVFAREFEALHRPHSVVVALSTSGNSPNILFLASKAREFNTPVIAFTGADGGRLIDECEVVRVPSLRTERIQEMHILLGHVLCSLIEDEVFFRGCIS